MSHQKIKSLSVQDQVQVIELGSKGIDKKRSANQQEFQNPLEIENNGNDIAIAFCVDKNYLKYCSVALLSLLRNGQVENPNIFILSEDIEEADIEKFKQLLSTFSGNFQAIKINQEFFQDFPLLLEHISKATYLRVLLPKILKDYQKILYLDSDILVTHSLQDLLSLNLQDYALAAVRDLCAESTCKMEVFNSGEKHYFNAGVILINTEMWNQEQITERFIEAGNDNELTKNTIKYNDQCLLNYIIMGEFKELETKFNTLVFDPDTHFKSTLALAPTPDLNKLEQYSILHFISFIKPWHDWHSIKEFKELYHSFAVMSPWQKEIELAGMPKSKVITKGASSESSSGNLEKWDYVSPGLETVAPDEAFPNMSIRRQDFTWPYCRNEIPHTVYVDGREPNTGFLNRDEAHILYNNALKFKGKNALEIGCWMGWSATHLMLAGVKLEVIDPLLKQPETRNSVTQSLQSAGQIHNLAVEVDLIPGYSPEKVEELVEKSPNKKWSLIFIDGNHTAPAPLDDTIAASKYLEPDGIILFHDLAAPDVGQGLDYLRDQGWKTMIYQTTQIMGVAWRGKIEPIHHQPDPRVSWTLPDHLQGYLVSGMSVK